MGELQGVELPIIPRPVDELGHDLFRVPDELLRLCSADFIAKGIVAQAVVVAQAEWYGDEDMIHLHAGALAGVKLFQVTPATVQLACQLAVSERRYAPEPRRAGRSSLRRLFEKKLVA